MGGRDWELLAPGLGQEAVRQAGNQGTSWQEPPWEGMRLELEAGQEHAAGGEAMVSEPLLFTALLLQPPVSDTLGEVGAGCAPRKCDCWVLPLGLVLAVRCRWSWQNLGCAAWRVTRWRRGRQDSSSAGGAGRGDRAEAGRDGDGERSGSPWAGCSLCPPCCSPAPARRAFSSFPRGGWSNGLVTYKGRTCHPQAAPVGAAVLGSMCPATLQVMCSVWAWPGFSL